MPDGQLILVAGALLAAGLAASLLASRLRVPGLVLFLGVGMAVGSDGAGWIDFDNYRLARTIGVIALALILFEGGLTSGLPEIRPVLGPAISLAVVGTALTALIAGLVAAALFDFSTSEGLLLGSIVAATDGAAIFALLRGSTLRRKLARTLEGESGLNDPIAVLLVLAFIHVIKNPGYDAPDVLGLFARQLGIGVAVGAAVGFVAVQGFRRIRLATSGLYPVASLATVALAYGGADALHGSGFLAAYLAGLALGTAAIPAKQTITVFHEGLAWVAQLAMFVTLGLLVFPSQLGSVAVKGIVLALVIAVVARPIATFAATAFARYSLAERVMLGWAGLRGAVPVVLATFPVIDHVPHSLEFFNIVFFAVVISTLLQGSTFEPLARRLGVTTAEPALPRPLVEAGTIGRLGAEVLEYPVAAGDAIAGARVRDLGLPREAVVNVIVRGEEAIPPRGSTRIREGDRLHVLLRKQAAGLTRALVERWRNGPIGRPPRPRRSLFGRSAIFTARRWTERDGDPVRPSHVQGGRVVEQLRIRRDRPGGLLLLADGRYAVTGDVVAVGSRRDVTQWAMRRMARTDPDERAWLRTVVGALAADAHE
ncbi:MAG: potassium/proton antiporter [Gaiellaceae bacterium]